MSVGISTSAAPLDKWEMYLRVIHALMLRDMRTRFGRTHWGWGLTALLPVAHMLLIGSFMILKDIPVPMCEDALLFVATGAAPVLMCKYISREVMKGMNVNKPLTYYPQVKKFDVLLARVLNEVIGGFAGLVAIFVVLIALNINPFPVDPVTSLCGYLAAILLGVGLGAVNIGISSVFPGWLTGYTVFALIMYVASGVAFMPCFLPEPVYALFKWNPFVQIVEWVRLGYEPSLPITVDYTYTVMWGACSLLVGLTFERFVMRYR